MTLRTAPEAIRVVTVGNPNVGKTSLINAIAGSDLKVGNWPGTTVDRLQVDFEVGGRAVHLVDLPGSYTLLGASAEERITRNELLNHKPDIVVNVLDASNLERNLHLTLELTELGIPTVVALNLNDEAASKGLHVDPTALQEHLRLPVVATVANRKTGVAELSQALLKPALAERPLVEYPAPLEESLAQLGPEISRWQALALLSDDEAGLSPCLNGLDPFLTIADARFKTARGIARAVTRSEDRPPTWGERLDRIVLHRLAAVPIFLLGMMLVFRFTYMLSQPWIDFMDVAKTVLSGWLAALPFPPLLLSFLSDGVVDGAGTVMAFAPVLFLLYLAMAFLETSGLLARTAFVCDRFMKLAGLPGRALIPLVLGFGCNVPAIYASRALPLFGDRLRVALAVPFMACSARLTVFVLFAAIFFPKYASWVVFGLYLMGLGVGLSTAWLLKHVVPMETDVTGVMELPSYRWPTWGAVGRAAWLRTRSFLVGATGPILGTVLIIWALHHVPLGAKPEDSLFASTSRAATVALEPLGIHDWRLTGALIPGFIAKEVVVGTLGVTYLGSQPPAPVGLGEGLGQLASGFAKACKDTVLAAPRVLGIPIPVEEEEEVPGSLRAAIAASISGAGAFAYLVFVLLYTPCVATVAAIHQEFGWRWAVVSVIYQLVVAYLAAALAYRLLC